MASALIGVATEVSRRPSVDKVICPSCGHGISHVVDTRGPDRLRECHDCRSRYITMETVQRIAPKGWSRLPSQRTQPAVVKPEINAIDRTT
jgi:hypothetical protein